MNTDERMAALMRLSSAFKNDRDVATMCASVCQARGCPDIGHLASVYPEVFDELVEAVDDLAEQLPAFGYRYGMSEDLFEPFDQPEIPRDQSELPLDPEWQ